MENHTETVDLDLEESNELKFKIRLEGESSSPAKVRLVCEGKDCSYMFSGYGTTEPEVVQFTLPKMHNKLSEGTYSARVEVLVENRYFSPLQFQINWKKTLNVVAESIQVAKPQKPELKVTATPIVARTQQSSTAPAIKFEQKPLEAQKSQMQSRPSSKPAQNSSTSEAKRSALREAYEKRQETDPVDDEAKLMQIVRNLLKKQ